jgi:hypothetical protein
MPFSRTVLLGLFGLAAVFSATTPSAAYDRWIDVYNDSQREVHFVYLSPDDPSPWGPDLLGEDILPPHTMVTLDPQNHHGYCAFVMKVQFAGGWEVYSVPFDICEVTEAHITSGEIRFE